MSEFPGSDAFAAEIHEAFAQPVIYTPDGGAPEEITAIYSDEPAPNFDGAGATLRTISWEVRQSDVANPQHDAMIEANGKVWRVNDITRRDDVGAWVLIVERAA